MGRPISQEDVERSAKSWIEAVLKDPMSAQYKWSDVQKGWTRDAPIEGGDLHFGYKLVVDVNAKNEYGGYTGFKPYTFLFKNGFMLRIYTMRRVGSDWYNLRAK